MSVPKQFIAPNCSISGRDRLPAPARELLIREPMVLGGARRAPKPLSLMHPFSSLRENLRLGAGHDKTRACHHGTSTSAPTASNELACRCSKPGPSCAAHGFYMSGTAAAYLHLRCIDAPPAFSGFAELVGPPSSLSGGCPTVAWCTAFHASRASAISNASTAGLGSFFFEATTARNRCVRRFPPQSPYGYLKIEPYAPPPPLAALNHAPGAVGARRRDKAQKTSLVDAGSPGCPIGTMGVELAPVGGREEASEVYEAPPSKSFLDWPAHLPMQVLCL